MPTGQFIERDITAAISRWEKRLLKAEKEIADLQRRVDKLEQHAETATVNNITFTWDGSALKVSWASGYVKDRSGTPYSVPAGQRTGLAVSTYYWAGWNYAQKTMSFVTDVNILLDSTNTLVISQFKTGTAVQSGTAGGGGAAPGQSGFTPTGQNLFA